jgi:hypothetical protein
MDLKPIGLVGNNKSDRLFWHFFLRHCVNCAKEVRHRTNF